MNSNGPIQTYRPYQADLRFSNRTGTSVGARGKDQTRLPVPNLPLCHWSSQLFDLRAPSSNDVPVLLLNRPIADADDREGLVTKS